MSMKYYKLFDLLTRKGMKKTDLLNNKIISSPTLAKLSKGETVTTKILAIYANPLTANQKTSWNMFLLIVQKNRRKTHAHKNTYSIDSLCCFPNTHFLWFC